MLYDVTSINKECINNLDSLINDIEEKYTLKGVMLTGSVSTCIKPNDIDLIFITDKGFRRFLIINSTKVPIEIEIIPENHLKSLTENIYWFVENWEFEMAKFKFGKIFYNDSVFLNNIIKISNTYPIDIARYLFFHRLGRCIHLARKWKKKEDYFNSFFTITFQNMVGLLLLAIRRKIPKRMALFASLKELEKKKLANIDSIEQIDDFLKDIIIQNKNNICLDDFFKENSNLLDFKFWYPAEIEGLKFLINNIFKNYNVSEVLFGESLS